MKILTRVLMGFGVLAILAIIALIVGYILYSLTPSIKGDLIETSVTATDAENWDAKFATFVSEIEQANIEKQIKEVRLTITEEEFNSKMIVLLAESDTPVTEAVINFRNGSAWLYTKLDNPGTDAKIGVIAYFTATEGKIETTVEKFKLGRLPLGSSYNERCASVIDIFIQLRAPWEQLPVTITDISVVDGEVIITGITSPTS